MTAESPSAPFNPPDRAIRKKWVELGCPIPPPDSLKHAVLDAYRKWSGAEIFVETGTYRGDTTLAMASGFPLVYTVEAYEPSYLAAKLRFAGYANVNCLFGDSAIELPRLLPRIHEPAVFWLDAHWCGPGTAGEVYSSAILGEVESLLSHFVRNHVLIIDDARYFTGEFGYPSIDQLRRLVAGRRPDLGFDVCMDIIRIHQT